MTSQPSACRYHALDSLRAAMMFLGIYLHAVVAYSPNGGWPYKQAELTSALDYTIAVIHIFRMPIFYVMAGFFAALLIQRYGFRRAAENRFWRVLIPFIFGWIIVFPLVRWLAVIARDGLDRAQDLILSGRFLGSPYPMHLWFLEYLIVFYVLAVIFVAMAPVLPSESIRSLLPRLFRSLVLSPLAPLFFAVPSFLTMLQMKVPWLEDPVSFKPVTSIVVAYAIPFAFGCLLFLDADLLETLTRRAWVYTGLAAVACWAYLAGLVAPMGEVIGFYAAAVAHSVALWFLIFGITGLFLRYLSGYSALRRYLCDSSYFLYIAHMPVIIMFQLLFKDVLLPPVVKIALVFTGTVAVLLPLYGYGVRPTFVGAILNGRKYPRSLTPAGANPA
jgi:glucans biosynthesis protein C